MDKYKSKSITLRNETHSKLTTLSKIIGKGISIPQTIDKIAEEKLSSNSKGNLRGITDAKHKEA